ncbi:MAG: hypothetical protein HY909_27850 [Deltaproteobacteria bacterium]|nr:hypothetical protein [Deltaproteobacteria bacterium]
MIIHVSLQDAVTRDVVTAEALPEDTLGAVLLEGAEALGRRPAAGGLLAFLPDADNPSASKALDPGLTLGEIVARELRDTVNRAEVHLPLLLADDDTAARSP